MADPHSGPTLPAVNADDQSVDRKKTWSRLALHAGVYAASFPVCIVAQLAQLGKCEGSMCSSSTADIAIGLTFAGGFAVLLATAIVSAILAWRSRQARNIALFGISLQVLSTLFTVIVTTS